MLVANLQLIKRIITISALSIMLPLVLASCSVATQNKVSHLIKTSKPKVFKVVSVDESGNEISNRLILEALHQKIKTLSLYPGFYSAIDDVSENVSGFDATINNNNSIKVQYLNGKLSSSGRHNLTKVTALFNVEIKKDNYGLFKTVTVYPPKSLYISRAKNKYSSIDTLDTPEKLQQDVEQIFANINLTLERLMFISGEIIVRNTDDEVFDNFEHKLGLYSKNSFQEKDMIFGIFELKSNLRKEIIPVRVRIFPNSKGSRVKYEFDVKYSINPDGSTSFNEQEINYLITTIKNVSTTKDLDAPINHVKVNNKNLIAIIDDPVLISNYRKTNPIDIHKTTVTYKPRKTTIKKTSRKKSSQSVKFKSKKIFKLPKTKQRGENKPTQQISSSKSKSNNIKNIEYIEKMLSTLNKKRPSK